MVRTKGLTFSYDSDDTVLKFPDIVLEKNQNLLILGKSGIGKTTLLHLLAGLLQPREGSIEIDQVPVHSLPNKKLDSFRGQQIGIVFQGNHAIESLSVFENVQARLYFAKKTISRTGIIELLEHLGILACKGKKVRELSEGQRQRLGIAMAMVHQPKLIMADEPTSSLDDENCNKVMQLLMDQANSNEANLIVITHDHRIKPWFNNTLEL